ncbi:MAG: HAD-IC family P-type ATPase, partial [Planctomycetes bacterium]|nr:HAD-IC family P-type ATPase [Planctomycetota bacterium]
NEVSIGLQSLVPGDIVLLKAGTVIPGDCRLLDSRELHVNESALTGESFPVEKETKRLPVDTPIAQRTNCLHLGTHVVSGSGTAVVVRIGKETALGEISSRLAKKPPKTSFERSLDQFGKLLLGITIALVMIVLCAQLLFQRPFVESLLFALALAVGMTPQLLPAITSVVLAKGAKAMAKEEVIVKKLLAIENFGSMNVLCVDKTGTLTEGTVKLSQTLDGFGTPSLHVLRLAQINATLQASFENPIDTAIRSEAGPDLRNVKKLDELPYDFNRRRLSVLYECEQEIGMVTKGAFASVIEICHQINQQGGSVDISPHLTSIQATFETLSQQGFRVLGVASRRLDSDTLSKTDEVGMTFEGFLVLADPLKPFIRETKSQLEELGITLKLITGDNRVVAASIAKQVGLRNGHCVTGKDIQQFSPEALQRSVLETDVFAEIEPNQKERIILALKDAGLIVGFLGDGINDAPALHSADVGISVASAVDVAKEAAQVVLLQHDIQVLAKGVREGRKTLANTLKYVFVSI